MDPRLVRPDFTLAACGLIVVILVAGAFRTAVAGEPSHPTGWLMRLPSVDVRSPTAERLTRLPTVDARSPTAERLMRLPSVGGPSPTAESTWAGGPESVPFSPEIPVGMERLTYGTPPAVRSRSLLGEKLGQDGGGEPAGADWPAGNPPSVALAEHLSPSLPPSLAGPTGVAGPSLGELPAPEAFDNSPQSWPDGRSPDPNGTPLFSASGPGALPASRAEPIVGRLGWWATGTDGSPIKTGEYQSLKSSLFWDVDGLASDGVRTLDLALTGLDSEATALDARYLGRSLSAEVGYQRFLRRFDRDPLDAWVAFDKQPAAPLPPPPANFRDMKEDLHAGEDFAIRVQELEGNFHGELTDRVRWKLKFWGLRKAGERQVVALGHCFTAPNATDVNGNPVGGVACHVVSQRQRIDWLTMEVEPAVEAKWGRVTAEYSRTMRTLTTGDETSTRPYDNFGFSGDQPVAVVPENFTEIDRLKLGADLPHRRAAYARIYRGQTTNRFRDTQRRFGGYDLRLTDRSLSGVSLTGYLDHYLQSGTTPTSLLPFESASTVRSPVGYNRLKLGMRGSWRPFAGEYSWRRGLVLSGGYEFRDLRRSNALFIESVLTADQGRTRAHVIRLRSALRWSPRVQTFVGYKAILSADPLYGVPIRNRTANTGLPTSEHLVELGTTWAPTDQLVFNGTFGIINRGNTSEIARFEEDDYNIVLSGWYAPASKWTLSGGLAFYRNWIDQDITLGSKSTPLTLPWDFGGQSDLVNLGARYAWTESVTLSGGYEFVRANNVAAAPQPFADIPPLSDVLVTINRFSAGADYRWQPGIDFYLRYQYFDYSDRVLIFNSGTASMILMGANATY